MILLTVLSFFFSAEFWTGGILLSIATLIIANNISSKQKASLQSALDAARAETQKVVDAGKAQVTKAIVSGVNAAAAAVKK